MAAYVPSNRSQQSGGQPFIDSSDGTRGFSTKLSQVDRRVWLVAGGVAAGAVAVMLYRRGWGFIPGRGPILPPDDPTGRLHIGDGSTELDPLTEASWKQAANHDTSTAEAISDSSEATVGSMNEATVASSPNDADAQRCMEENESASQSELLRDIRATSSLHADGGICLAEDRMHCWSEDDVVVVVEASANGLSRSQVEVKMKAGHLFVRLADKTIIDSKLSCLIHPEDSTWQLEDGPQGDRCVIVTLQKASPNKRWGSLLAK